LRNGSEIGPALDRISLAVFVLACGLHFAMLLARTEAWRLVLGVAAGGRAPPRVPVHAASAVGFVVGAVETPAALPVRMGLLRRLAPDSSAGDANDGVRRHAGVRAGGRVRGAPARVRPRRLWVCRRGPGRSRCC